MDETEDHEPSVANVSDATVKLTTLVTTTATTTVTTTETKMEEFVEGEGGGNGEGRESVSKKLVATEEGGDVMVEVSDSEVLVDGVRGQNEEVGRGHGDDGVKGRKLGGGEGEGGVKGAGKVEDVDVCCDEASREMADGVGEDRAQETGVERGEERKLHDEDRVTETLLAGGGTEVQEDSVSHNVDLKRNIENGIRRCTTQSASVGDGNDDDNARASLDAEKEASEVQSVEVVDSSSVISETKTEEKVMLEKSDKEAVSTDGTHNQANDSEGGHMEVIDGVREQSVIAEKAVSVGATSQNEDEMIKPSDPVACSHVDKQQVQVQSKETKADEKINVGSALSETDNPDISVGARVVGGLFGSPKQNGTEESESQPLLPDKSHVEAVDQRNGCAPDTVSVDRNAIEGVVQFGSSMEDNQQEQETANLNEQAKSPYAHEHEEALSDSVESQSNDKNEDCEHHTAHGQGHLPEQSPQGTTLFEESAMIGVSKDASDVEDSQEGQEEADVTEEVQSPDELEVDEEVVSDSAKPSSKEGKTGRRGRAKSKNLVKNHPVSYQVPPEDEGEFSVSDLVWGKVKSHPWWPGQIFHPFDSSEKAKKYIRKDCYLVAYFGDKSFAWNDGSVLKPFFKHFSEEEKQSNTESFQNAVTCALEEVSRRVELGLACPCISEEIYDKIKYQIVDNAGIRQESSKREGVDWSTGVDHFHPDKFVQYVKALALSPTSGASRLDLVIAKAQLLAFNRLKGFDELPDFEYYDGIMECGAGSPPRAEEGETQEPVAGGDAKTRLKVSNRRKHNLKDIVYQRRKEKSLTELMGESIYYFDGDFDSPEEDDAMLSSPTSGAKRKAASYFTDDFTGHQSTKTISVAKVSNDGSPNPQQSFKVGECIRRVASQLTGSSSIVKATGDGSNTQHLTDDADEVSDPPEDSLHEEETAPKTEVSTEEMLLQLQLSARDPMKGYSFLAGIVGFFSEFRNLAVSTQRQRMRKGSGRKRKHSEPATGAPQNFEFDDRNDSYWTDMVVQNNSEAKPRKRGRKRKEDRPSGDPDKPLKSNPRKYSRKQYFHGNHESVGEIPSQAEKQQEQLPTGPTELILNFSESGSMPSEVNLNKMFKRFGPLKESETEIDAQNCRAKVVFKKRSDAEVAYSSAAMFNIFGSALVNYQLNHIPSVPAGGAPLASTDGREDAT